jgi:hypothetical protein
VVVRYIHKVRYGCITPATIDIGADGHRLPRGTPKAVLLVVPGEMSATQLHGPELTLPSRYHQPARLLCPRCLMHACLYVRTIIHARSPLDRPLRYYLAPLDDDGWSAVDFQIWLQNVIETNTAITITLHSFSACDEMVEQHDNSQAYLRDQAAIAAGAVPGNKHTLREYQSCG